MNTTQYYSHVIDNDLHKLWTIYSNPKEDGIRLSAWTPHRDAVHIKTRPCRRDHCNLVQTLRNDLTVGKYECPCGHQHSIIHRWKNANPSSGKICFRKPAQIKQIAGRVHTMYHTAAIFDPSIIMLPREHSYPFSHVRAYTTHFDIDVVSQTKTILDNRTRASLQVALDYIRSLLDTCCPNSYCVQSSGNGLYVTIHHTFCEGDDVADMLAKVRMVLEVIKIDISSLTSSVKLDHGINNVSRVFKSMGSMHQKYNYLCAVPFDPDVDLMEIDTSMLLTKNFTVDRIAPDGKINWNNRVKSSEKSDFIRFLDDTCDNLNMKVDRGTVTDVYTATYKGNNIRYTLSNFAALWTSCGSRVYTGEMKQPMLNTSAVPDTIYRTLLESVEK